jgi:hypothetical protein
MDVIKLLGGVEKMRRDFAQHEKDAADALSPREPYKNAALFLKECGLRLRLGRGYIQYNEHPPGAKVGGQFGREPFCDMRDDWVKAQLLLWLKKKKKRNHYGVVVGPFDPSARELNELLKALKLVLSMPEEPCDNVVKLRR